MNPPQHEIALERANQIRFARAELKRGVKAGTVKLADFLRDEPPSWLESERLERVLRAMPGLGTVRIRKMLGAMGVSPLKPVGTLTPRQRHDLANRLEAKGYTVPYQQERVAA